MAVVQSSQKHKIHKKATRKRQRANPLKNDKHWISSWTTQTSESERSRAALKKKVKGRPEAAGAARQPLQESAGSASVSGGLSTIISAW